MSIRKSQLIVTLALTLWGVALPARAQEPYVSEVRLFGMTFCPRGWLEANGAILSIAQNTALFSLLGTTYGGNGQTTFALPDLRGRMPIGFGQGSGLSSRTLGETGGVESVTLGVAQIPSHSHDLLSASTGKASSKLSEGNSLARKSAKIFTTAPADTPLAPDSIGATGGSQPHENMPPYLVLKYCIAVEGIFPSQ